MGSQRGGGAMSENQSKAAQKAYSAPRPAEQQASAVSPSSLIKRRIKPDAVKAENQQVNNTSKTN